MVSVKISRTVSLVAVVLWATGCAGKSKQEIGGTVGTVAGAVVGSMLGDGAGRGVRELIVAAGAIGGYLVGQQMGKYLDDQDRAKMAVAAQQALETNEIQSWSSKESGNTGWAEIVAATRDPRTGQKCRTVRNTLVLPDGREVEDDFQACRNGEVWERVEA